MFRPLRPYTSYKNLGVGWLKKVPEEWEVRKLKTIAININEQTSALEDTAQHLLLTLERIESWTGKIRMPTQGQDKPFEGSGKKFLANDILFGKLRPYLAKVTRPTKPGICVTEFLVLRPVNGIEPAYLERLLRSRGTIDLINSTTHGAKMPRAEWDVIGDILLPVPPLPEQRAIVKFLDWAERRIRFIIAARKRRIQLLEEYRQALINDVVTGKFDVRTGKPYPSYKDSGVPWLGEVPEGWEIKPLKHWVRINQRNLSEETKPDFEFEYYDISSVGTGKLVEKPEVLTFKNAPSRARRLLKPGDTLFSTVRTYLKATFTYWKSQNPGMPAVASTGFAVLSPSPESLPYFVSFLAQTEAFANYVAALSVGIAYPAISETTFGAIKVPVPPLPEQRAIAEYLDRETAKIDAAIEKTKESIALWEELRETLISDVVTGKLDVREAAKKLPEAEPELEAKLEALEAALREDSEAADPAESEDQPEEAPA